MRARGLFLACLLLGFGPARTAAQFVWNPTTEFSTTNGNPNGVWTYGWMDTGFNTFTAYTNVNANAWYGWGGDLTPLVWLNTSTSTLNGAPPGYLVLHPGNGTEPSVLRWTAPAGVTGPIHVTGQFLAGDGAVMQVAIFQNTKSNTLFSAADAGVFNFSANVVPGDTLNFAVYGGYFFGTTPLEVSLVGVPEPSTLALLSLGLAVLCRVYRRRKG